MNKDTKTLIKELEEKRKHLWEEDEKLKNKISSILLEDKDYTGKYVKTSYGYMYVVYQHLDTSKTVCKDDCVFIQGFCFNYSNTVYNDSLFLNFDADGYWKIPLRDFINGAVTEISKDKFFELFNKNSTETIEAWIKMLEKYETK